MPSGSHRANQAVPIPRLIRNGCDPCSKRKKLSRKSVTHWVAFWMKNSSSQTISWRRSKPTNRHGRILRNFQILIGASVSVLLKVHVNDLLNLKRDLLTLSG